MRGVTIYFLVFCAISLGVSSEPYHGTVADFVGINSNVGAYDDQIVGRLAKIAKWMREYHNWNHFEKNDNVYAWDDTTPSGYGTWPFHTKFVQECIKHDINLLICLQGSTEWASATGATDAPPYGSHDGTKEAHYIDKAEFLAQLVARYGDNKVDAGLLETTDKQTGLGYVKYYEDSNEPDYWWHTPLWPGDLYGIHLNAIHDGRNLTTSDSYPLLGIKNADPNAIHVLGGLANYDENYLNGILQAADDRLPFDIINFHHYCTQGWGTQRGICPEHKTYGLKPAVDKWQTWRDKHASGKALWLTEFGWDTYKSSSNASSYVYAGEESQANYLLRSLFLLMGYGIDKGFIFFDKDPDSESTTQYASCGVLTDKKHGLQAKPAYYYLATLQNLLGEYSFVSVDKYGEGDPEVYAYLLQSPNKTTQYCYVLWCRNPGAKYDDGTTIINYQHARPSIQNAMLIEPINQQEYGQGIDVVLENAGTESSVVFIPALSEKPVFLFVEFDQPLSIDYNRIIINDFQMNLFPNPFNAEIRIDYELKTAADTQFEIYNMSGRLIDCIHTGRRQPGQHQQRIDFSEHNLSTGVYIIRMLAGWESRHFKVCYVK
ncbi:T9SS type A sorting domain-containing protein [candidate division KSB1 bacterium]|nr:T9SS type A sorting domain-containing protein [candidate division KSB1 bacterium]